MLNLIVRRFWSCGDYLLTYSSTCVLRGIPNYDYVKGTITFVRNYRFNETSKVRVCCSHISFYSPKLSRLVAAVQVVQNVSNWSCRVLVFILRWKRTTGFCHSPVKDRCCEPSASEMTNIYVVCVSVCVNVMTQWGCAFMRERDWIAGKLSCHCAGICSG